MPNHIRNRVAVEGPQKEIDRFRETCFKIDPYEPDSGACLDFNSVIPMPKSIRNTESGGTTDYGLMAFGGGDWKEALDAKWIKEAGVRTKAELQAFLDARGPQYRIQGQLAADNLKRYGHKDWYSWAVANWGTKWNSYDFKIIREKRRNYLVFRFDTAWSPPVPVFLAISKKFPKLKFTVLSYDECGNFACEGWFKAGNAEYDTVPATTRQRRRTYME